MNPVILWFRRNLRLHDNLALCAAADTGRPVVPVYISDDLDAGGASCWWLHHSLRALDAALREHGSGLVVRNGEPAEVLPELVDATGAGDLYASGFLHGLAIGAPLDRCAELGSIAAGEIISHVGARPHVSLADLAG